MALTGTADKDTESTIIRELSLKNTESLFVSPNRFNLLLSIYKVPRTDMLKQLDWLVNMIKEHGKETPKTIVFCDTMYSIASVVNYLMMSLGDYAFYPRTSKKRADSLIGIFQSLSHKENKERLLMSLKTNGLKRIAVASTALSMGVNFPDVRYVVLCGPARTLLDYHQEAGRAGRDGQPANVILYFYGQQLSHCDEDVRDFLKTDGCYRVASYKSFDENIVPLSPRHDCCNFCAAGCCQSSDECSMQSKPFHKQPDEEKNIVNGALLELQNSISQNIGTTAFGHCHGFSTELISDVVENCHTVFTR